jgi:hypothetical protein
MCAICDQATKLPVDQALKLVGEAMKKRGGKRGCLDKLVGKLVDVGLDDRNMKAEEEWERGRR